MWQNVPALGADAYLAGSLASDGSEYRRVTSSGVRVQSRRDLADVESRQVSAVRSELELANLTHAARPIGRWS